MTTTQQPMKLAMKCVYCGSVKHEAREASGTCIQELIYALNDSVKREQLLREALVEAANVLQVWKVDLHKECSTVTIQRHMTRDEVLTINETFSRARAALAATEAK